MNDLALLDFVYLALKDPHAKNRESLIERTCAYGRAFGVTKEMVEKIINKKLIDLIGKET